jgi:hypothetical protein
MPKARRSQYYNFMKRRVMCENPYVFSWKPEYFGLLELNDQRSAQDVTISLAERAYNRSRTHTQPQTIKQCIIRL